MEHCRPRLAFPLGRRDPTRRLTFLECTPSVPGDALVRILLQDRLVVADARDHLFGTLASAGVRGSRAVDCHINEIVQSDFELPEYRLANAGVPQLDATLDSGQLALLAAARANLDTVVDKTLVMLTGRVEVSFPEGDRKITILPTEAPRGDGRASQAIADKWEIAVRANALALVLHSSDVDHLPRPACANEWTLSQFKDQVRSRQPQQAPGVVPVGDDDFDALVDCLELRGPLPAQVVPEALERSRAGRLPLWALLVLVATSVLNPTHDASKREVVAHDRHSNVPPSAASFGGSEWTTSNGNATGQEVPDFRRSAILDRLLGRCEDREPFVLEYRRPERATIEILLTEDPTSRLGTTPAYLVAQFCRAGGPPPSTNVCVEITSLSAPVVVPIPVAGLQGVQPYVRVFLADRDSRHVVRDALTDLSFRRLRQGDRITLERPANGADLAVKLMPWGEPQ